MDRLAFLSARNLGDAVFHAAFLRGLVDAGFARRYLVWTFPAAAFLFEAIPGVEIVRSAFPMGATIRAFARGGFIGTLRAARRIRAWRPDATLELVGDFRERRLGAWMGGARHFTPEWPAGHAFRRHNRIPPSRPSSWSVPDGVHNLYDAYDHLLRQLTGRTSPVFRGDVPRREPPEPESIGLHPFASAAFKLWPLEHWQTLMTGLRADRPGVRFILFGTEVDRPVLDTLARAADPDRCEIVVGTLPVFRDRVARLGLLIGLDSFSVHLAHSLGVPSVLLVGANDPGLFTPPSATPLYRQSGCVHQPCGGRPRCVGRPFEYICMKAIDPASARAAAHERLVHPTPESTTA